MRFRATATINWDFDADDVEKAKELVENKLENLSVDHQIQCNKNFVKLDKLKDKIEKIKLGEFQIDEVIPFISKEKIKREYICDGVKHQVKMNSDRYFLFRECMNCVACGLEGTKIFLECHPADRSPHFNLYGVEDNKLILMTKDHIHAKSCGGENRHSNYQTMCIVCNNLKGHYNLTLDGVRELRSIYNENKDKVTKKVLHNFLEEARLKLSRPSTETKSFKQRADSVCTIYDINLYKDKNGIHGRLVYDEAPEDHEHIGCIKKGVYLEPLAVMKNTVMCNLQGGEVFTLNLSFVE